MGDRDLRERNWCKLSAFKPMNGCRVDCYGLLSTDIRTILQVSVLTFLLCLQIKAREPTEIFLHNGFVDCCTTPDTLTIVVGHPVQIIS